MGGGAEIKTGKKDANFGIDDGLYEMSTPF
jgi:hypothetical protein